MSQENLDTIRRGYADLNRRDVQAWLNAFHADAEMHDLAGGPEAPPGEATRRCALGSSRSTAFGRTVVMNPRRSSTPATLLSSPCASAVAGDIPA